MSVVHYPLITLLLMMGCKSAPPTPGPARSVTDRPAEVAAVPVVPVSPAEPSEPSEPSEESEESEPLLVSEGPAGMPARVTDSGIRIEVLEQGTGTSHPSIDDSVRVHYEGWTSSGGRFDSSRARARPATFRVSAVIEGWQEVLQLMVEGDRWQVVIPAALAYGKMPERAGTPAGDLTFDIELIEILAAPPAPADVAAPPPTATVTASGLAYRVLKRGQATAHPAASDTVEVDYTGWTTDGRMFDSSIPRGRSVELALGNVIKGWTEVLQLMSPGDVFRVWIPAPLAYGHKPKRAGAPAGMLVFDIELLAIKP